METKSDPTDVPSLPAPDPSSADPSTTTTTTSSTNAAYAATATPRNPASVEPYVVHISNLPRGDHVKAELEAALSGVGFPGPSLSCDLVVKKANREAAYAFARLPETEEAAAAVRLVVARCGVGGADAPLRVGGRELCLSVATQARPKEYSKEERELKSREKAARKRKV
jgi:hypothetical protein